MARHAFRAVRWDWTQPFILQVPTPNGRTTINLQTQTWKDAAHVLRDAGRWNHIVQELPRNRWNLHGIERGIDYEQTRKLLTSKHLSFLQRGYLRTIVAGSIMTPSRWLAAGRLNEISARCVHCQNQIVETAGHRYWYCTRWTSTRSQQQLDNFDEATWPRCLTRCGVAPTTPVVPPDLLRRIQI